MKSLYNSKLVTSIFLGSDSLAGTYKLFSGSANFLPICMYVVIVTFHIERNFALV